jgi:hypothetical protein
LANYLDSSMENELLLHKKKAAATDHFLFYSSITIFFRYIKANRAAVIIVMV